MNKIIIREFYKKGESFFLTLDFIKGRKFSLTSEG